MKINIRVSMKDVSGKFTWIYPDGDKVQLDYDGLSPWVPGEPVKIKSHDCVYFWYRFPGQWDNYRCSYKSFTICEHTY